jgi:hypothetical protein
VEPDETWSLGSRAKSDTDYDHHIGASDAKGIRPDAYLLSTHLHGLTNRVVRGPYATWSCLPLDETCERRTSSVTTGEAVYSIVCCGASSIFVVQSSVFLVVKSNV